MRTILAHILSMLAGFSIFPDSATAQETPQRWFEEGRQTVSENLEMRGSFQGMVARNIILFVGDGMGVSTVTAARIFEGQLRGETGEENLLSFEEFPNLALSKTYNTNAQVADSAGTMSAMATGIKTKAGLISVNQNVIRGDCDSQKGNHLLTFLERAEIRGLSTGVVTTARLTHATPAANYAHIMDRDFEDDADAASLSFPGDCADIARQLIEFADRISGSDGLEVAMGGGRASFIPQSVNDPESRRAGNRHDGRDLTEEWQELAPGSDYVWNSKQFEAIDPSETEHLLGLFNSSHMQYELNRSTDIGGEPSLSEMTAKAIDILSKNNKGYFLQVESGRIDHAHHATSPIRALTDTIEFSNAIRTTLEKVDLNETLIIVTADHSHVFTIAGYPKRGNPILGKSVGLDSSGEPVEELSLAADGLPYTTLSYANGEPASFGGQPLSLTEYRRSNLTRIDTLDESFRPQVTVPMYSETHGGEDVAIYSIGPGSDLVRGVMEQNVIFHIMMEASQLEQR
ncbi:MAG: alkaline phosphatase [Gammaproteobacteria bacterium]|nr:alkaline phosphatase [Gammaproteobacteria bacterium]MCY4358048.1 alkaline phosphatase [Gammaproteobacteria bacterium]